MFDFVSLDVATPTATRIFSDWYSDCLVVRNLTPYPLYINWRTTSLPNTIAYDDLVPAGITTVIAAKGNNFGFRLDTTGAVTPTIGEKCFITIQSGEVIPSFSNAQWKFIVQNTYAVNAGTPSQSFSMNVSGSEGLLLYFVPDVAFPNTEGGSVLLETSNDNNTYTQLDEFVLTIDVPTTKIYPVTTPYFRVTISRIKGTASGVFNWSLLKNYTPKPTQYQTDIETVFSATLTNNSNVQVSFVGELKAKRILLSFETPSATPTDYIFSIVLAFGQQSRTYRIASNPTLATGIMIIGSDCITYCRQNRYAYDIPIEQSCKNGLIVTAVNQSGASLSNVSMGAEVELAQ